MPDCDYCPQRRPGVLHVTTLLITGGDDIPIWACAECVERRRLGPLKRRRVGQLPGAWKDVPIRRRRT